MIPPLITQSQDVLGGMPVFYGTRVPVQTLLDYLTTDETLDAFLASRPCAFSMSPTWNLPPLLNLKSNLIPSPSP